MLLTLTFSHSQSESLKSLLERQRKAYKIFLETTKVKEIFKHFGVKYKIRSLKLPTVKMVGIRIFMYCS